MIRIIWMKLIRGKDTQRVRMRRPGDSRENTRAKSTPFPSGSAGRQTQRAHIPSGLPRLLNTPSGIPPMTGTGSFPRGHPWGSSLFLLALNFNRFLTKMSAALAWFSSSRFSCPGANLENRETAHCGSYVIFGSYIIFGSLQISQGLLCPLLGTRHRDTPVAKPARYPRTPRRGFCSSLAQGKVTVPPKWRPGGSRPTRKTCLSFIASPSSPDWCSLQ